MTRSKKEEPELVEKIIVVGNCEFVRGPIRCIKIFPRDCPYAYASYTAHCNKINHGKQLKKQLRQGCTIKFTCNRCTREITSDVRIIKKPIKINVIDDTKDMPVWIDKDPEIEK